MRPYYRTQAGDFILYDGDVREVVPMLPDGGFDAVFADPPYFLSNGGISVQAGKQVSVDKGAWDKSHGSESDAAFTCEWLKACRDKLTDDGSIWVCGTFHNIFTVATALTDLDFRILNAITWQKTNPPPNLSCRFFTHSTEIVIWARKNKKIPHHYNYDLMHRLAGNRQMTDVWRMPAIAPWEKSCGKHPTQKPLALVVRALLACTNTNGRVLDPFAGSSTTGIAANLIGRQFVGVEKESEYLEMSKRRRQELPLRRDEWVRKIPDLRELTERKDANERVNSAVDETISETIKSHSGVSRSELIAISGNSRATIARVVSELVHAGRIERRGSKKTGGYHVIESECECSLIEGGTNQ